MSQDIMEVNNQVKSIIQKGDQNNLWPEDLNSYQKNQLAYLAVQYGLDPFFGELTVLGGKPFVTASGLKRNAYDSNNPPISIQTELFDGNVADRWWEYKASLWKENTPKDRPYIEFGEASPLDCNSKISGSDKDLKAMARTRAVSRVLRLAYNINLTTAEEVSGYDPETQEVRDITPQKEIKDKKELSRREKEIKEIVAGSKELRKELLNYLEFAREDNKLEKIGIDDLDETQFTELKKLLFNIKTMTEKTA